MELEAVSRLTRDLANAAKEMSVPEARFLVDQYYTMQDNRIAANNQKKALDKSGEPNSVLVWLTEQDSVLEKQIRRALDKWTDMQPLGVWAKSICGIGEVIAAGLLANINFEKVETAGDVWAYAGLVPGMRKTRGQKITWNPALKRLAWIIGESFIKVSGRESDIYGKYYLQRKKYEWKNNLAGRLADQAADALKTRKIEAAYTLKWYQGELDPVVVAEWLDGGKDMLTIPAAAEGRGVAMLPPAHIQARSSRWAVKLFLAHYVETGYRLNGKTMPLPYPIQILGHSPEHYIPAPA